MTQRNPKLQKPPVLVWVGLGLLLLGTLLGRPDTFQEHALQTLCMATAQGLMLGTMLHVAWRAGYGTPRVLLVLLALLVGGISLQLWGLWDLWQVELINRRRGL